MSKTKDSLSSVANAMRLLKEFSIEERELGISELSMRLGLAKSTVFRLMNSLKEAQLVEKNEETKKYYLGIGALELGFVVYHSLELRKKALPYMDQLMKRTRRVVRLATYDHGGIVYLAKKRPDEDDPTISDIGNRAPAYCTSVGRVLLAHQPEQEIIRVLSDKLAIHTSTTKICPEVIKKELTQVQQTGFAVTYGEYRNGVGSVAVPIYNDFGRVVGAISLTGPQNYFHSIKLNNYVNELKMHSRLISEQLGLEFAL
ncbi:IclR family transcriptional regulator [Bacillus sp. Marseille-P3661]|uniref:IclR family transcriptional regulator n=1 Tax=Bacillus sp. Marseille-P3661 TaxID=1936234 RepID=UPI0015E1B5BE|nr:IclR family transcriptional regulator [Bacillus sp. Marseille-P3661]